MGTPTTLGPVKSELAAEQVGHVHEAGFYRSDDEFRALIVPFVEAGAAAGEPVVLGYDERKSDLLRSWLADPGAVTFIADASLYASPARAIEAYRRLFEQHVAAGARQVRIAGDVPHDGNGGRFDGWDRYESAVNVVWDQFPVRSLCLYDATTVSTTVRDVVERTHPRLVTPSGERRVNARYQDAFSYAALRPTADPLEATAPVVELRDPLPAECRRALDRLDPGRLDAGTRDDLRLAVSEAVTNARLHGKGPTSVRMWAGDDRVVVHVHDSGPGPSDTFAGLVPAAKSTRGAGLGLWLTHQLDIDIALLAEPDGFTVRLRGALAGTTSP